MDDPSVVVERGVLTAPAEVGQLAVCRAEVIGRMPDGDAVGHAAADTAAELGISRRQVYELLRRWRAGSGGVSDLVPGKSSGGRGREQLSA
ncbi:helix-turn-helix domain-containing protein [Salinispora fenicalii]|uniref:helix-turn-helix domain-containing protein n=1 Tax=Salinispora fenicalii TaxID=1137263 RepID=UPI0004840862|nr:helix-turn-helix domain-containing protein [Salinispora fenicalii]